MRSCGPRLGSLASRRPSRGQQRPRSLGQVCGSCCCCPEVAQAGAKHRAQRPWGQVPPSPAQFRMALEAKSAMTQRGLSAARVGNGMAGGTAEAQSRAGALGSGAGCSLMRSSQKPGLGAELTFHARPVQPSTPRPPHRKAARRPAGGHILGLPRSGRGKARVPVGRGRGRSTARCYTPGTQQHSPSCFSPTCPGSAGRPRSQRPSLVQSPCPGLTQGWATLPALGRCPWRGWIWGSLPTSQSWSRDTGSSQAGAVSEAPHPGPRTQGPRPGGHPCWKSSYPIGSAPTGQGNWGELQGPTKGGPRVPGATEPSDLLWDPLPRLHFCNKEKLQDNRAPLRK